MALGTHSCLHFSTKKTLKSFLQESHPPNFKCLRAHSVVNLLVTILGNTRGYRRNGRRKERNPKESDREKDLEKNGRKKNP